MKFTSKVYGVLAALALSGCVYAEGGPNRAASGTTVIGGTSGAVLSHGIGHDRRPAGLGRGRGVLIGQNIAIQERELTRQLAGSGVQIVNSGSQLRVILPQHVSFPDDSSSLYASVLPMLREVARSLRAHPNSTVRVVGHTDRVGSALYNQQLSQDRARSMARILISDGLAAHRLTYSGRGYYEPITSNPTAFGRAQNRRVEIVITPTN